MPRHHSDIERIRGGTRRLTPEAAVFEVSAVRGDGIAAAAEWLAGKCRRA